MEELEFVADVPRLPPRDPAGHKGTFGRVLIVAGSRGMSGAAMLSGLGALRGGAGLVQVAVPAEILPIVAGYDPCYLTAGLPQDKEGRLSASAETIILELAEACDVLAAGPGLGRSDALVRIVKNLIEKMRRPLVVDADGLNALAETWSIKPRANAVPRAWPLILTPHPGEFARLTGKTSSDVQADRVQSAAGLARQRNVIVVLKGHESIVTDGRRVYCNQTGNPGMATGGSGDVLTGLIAALIAQKLEPFAAAQLGVYVHGLAGDLAKEALGETAMTAVDVADHLAKAFIRLSV